MNQNSDDLILGVIQARMNSSRLPGKILKEISEKPLIWHINNRLKNSKHISKIVIATTNLDSDKPLRDFAESEGIEYFSGSENNILDRLYQTGKKFNATILVRITADCPLVDPNIVDMMIDTFLYSLPRPDLVTNSLIKTYPDGLDCEIINFDSLSKLCKTTNNSFWQEFPLMYMVENPEKFSIINVENDENISSLRWTVDYEEDLKFVRKIYENLYSKNKIFGMNEILSFLDKNPELKNINSKYQSNTGQLMYEKLKSNHNELEQK